MKSFFLFLALLFLFFYSGLAQKIHSIKGTIVDTSFRISLQYATISILKSKDSILVSFTRAKEDGSFFISGIPEGRYILLLTYPGYADYVEPFVLDSIQLSKNFPRLNMIQKAKLLAEIIVKGKAAAIKIKGDTTEFNASAYNIQANAKVEDLLKQLPGIEIDKDGKITAQGQSVKKVLVDGEEFFGDDPTLVTKNIRADMVDKVQVYDKKSDQAAFTGIDDGEKSKTINIKLKSDKKNGYFGKIEAGVGTDGYYQNQVLFNRFKSKYKFSVYGILANTGKLGLGWQDNQKYGSSNGVEFGDGFVYITNNGDEFESFDGQYGGQGIPTATTGGFHFDSKWNADKEGLNTNYKFGSISVDGTNNNLNQINLPSGSINSNSDQSFHRHIFKQKLDGTYQIKLDSTSNIKIIGDASLKNSQTQDQYNSISSDGNSNLLNKNPRNLNNNTKETILDLSALYTKKFKKERRTFSANLTQKYDGTNSNGYLKSEIDFFNGKTIPDSIQRIDQSKIYHTSSFSLNSKFTYTEPLSKHYSLILDYGLGFNQSRSNRQTFNPGSPGVYDSLVRGLSNNFQLNQISNQAGIGIHYTNVKSDISFGSNITNVSFRELDLYNYFLFKRNFINLNPQVYYKYKISKQGSLDFRYNGNTKQPTIDQIQPVLINTDPLNITLGNQNLKPSFTHSFTLVYNSYKVLTSRYIYLYGNISFTTHPITNTITTNNLTGASTLQYVNLYGQKPLNFNASLYYGSKISAWDLQPGINMQINGNLDYSLSNGLLNLNKSINYRLQGSLNKSKEKKYEFYLMFGPIYNISQSSLQPQLNNNGLGWDGNGNGTLYLPARFQIYADADYQFRPKTISFNQSFQRLLINASVGKKFLKDGPLLLKLSGNDLLNQNVGFNRTSNNNSLTQTSYNTIRRYFMISLSWDFNKAGTGNSKN